MQFYKEFNMKKQVKAFMIGAVVLSQTAWQQQLISKT
jgi:hypothetical protein